MPSQEQLIALVNRAAVKEGVEVISTQASDWVSYRVQGDPIKKRRIYLLNNNGNGVGRVRVNRSNQAEFGTLPHVGPVDWHVNVAGAGWVRVTHTPNFARGGQDAWLALFQQILGMANPGGNAMIGLIP